MMKGFTVHPDKSCPRKWKVAYKKPGGGRSFTSVYGTRDEAQTVASQKREEYIKGCPEYRQQQARHRIAVDQWQSNNTVDRRTLYLCKDSISGFYKIGVAKKPAIRERTLQAQCPTVAMVGQWKGLAFMESELHKQYSNQRVRGEWFDLSKAQVRFLCHMLTKEAKRA